MIRIFFSVSINLFNVNNEWLLSTRSNIGCTNKWSQDINFKEMFDECSKNLDYESLYKDHTYSFVMRHTKNKMISKIDKNELLSFFTDWKIIIYREEGTTGNIDKGFSNNVVYACCINLLYANGPILLLNVLIIKSFIFASLSIFSI